jgi:hypothetical protein
MIAVVALAIGCTRPKPPPEDPRPTPAAASASSAPDAALGISHAATAQPPQPAEDAGVAKTIALPDAPLLTLRALGPALVELTLDDAAADRASWKKIEIERRPVGADASASPVQRDSFEKPATRDRKWKTHVHTALQGTSYAYRARATGAWSPEVTVRMPDPTAPPPSPSTLRARAESPFAARLSWEADAQDAAGFELQVKMNEAFVRAALVDPTAREFVHHLRLPGQVVTYRVRAFNAAGASPPSPVATLTMPERVDVSGAKQLAMGPCIAPITRAPKSSSCAPEISILDGGSGHVVSNVPGAGNGCMRHLVGEYAGCPREFGVFELQADVTVVKGHSDEGFPLLHAIAGAGQYVGAQIQTLRFARGRYTVADVANLCGDAAAAGSPEDPTVGVVTDDLERCAPPFEICQRDPTPF